MNAPKQPTTYQRVIKNVVEGLIFDLHTLIDDAPPCKYGDDELALREAKKHVFKKLLELTNKTAQSL